MKVKHCKSSSRLLISTIVLFLFSAFILLAINDLSILSFVMALFVPAIFFIATMLIPRIFSADRLMLSIVNFLCALGVLILYRMSPQKGLNQAVNYGVGLGAMLFFIYFVRLTQRKEPIIILLVAVSAILMVLPLIFGTERNGARAWVTLFGFGFQPSELVKVIMLIIETYFLSKRKILSAALYAGFCLLVLMLQKDLGTALIYYGVILVMLYAATRNYIYLGIGFLGGVLGSAVGYNMFNHVKVRVSIWINPWLDYDGAGYQIVQSLIAMVNGGMWGTGLGLGNAFVIPAHTTDFIFSVILNEFGLIFGICILLMYLLLFWRGINIALRCNSRFNSLLALGSSMLIALQTFVIIGGNIKMIPLTGVTLPFISYGGSSLLSSMCIMGILQGVASINDIEAQEDKELAQIQGERI